MNRFARKSLEEEVALLKDPTGKFDDLKEYLLPLILQALERVDLSDEEARLMQEKILGDIPIAARAFLGHARDEEGVPFSTYFTWYVAQRINKAP